MEKVVGGEHGGKADSGQCTDEPVVVVEAVIDVSVHDLKWC